MIKQKPHFQCHEFNRMLFGLKNVPAAFQRLMNLVLSALTGFKSFVYLDDIVVYGNSLQHHNDNLKDVFTRLRAHNLTHPIFVGDERHTGR